MGEFIYAWGSGHYSRMMRLDCELRRMRGDIEAHYISKEPILSRLRRARAGDAARIHEIAMPTPPGGASGPSIARALAALVLPVGGSAPIPAQISSYLRAEGRLCDRERFELVISDGDVGSNVIASRRGVPSVFVTNQYRPRLYASRFYLRPAAAFVSRQIAKADRILVADSPPPHCICEYNLNIPDELMRKVEFVGHFAEAPRAPAADSERASPIERLAAGGRFGYWMVTGDGATRAATARRFREAFSDPRMAGRRRIVSHASPGSGIDCVLGRDGSKYTAADAAERGIDWLQIDAAYLTEREQDAVLGACTYAVVNGSHTVLGEILGARSTPVIGIPVYDEHTNHLRWVQERGMGVLARGARDAAAAAAAADNDPDMFTAGLSDFAAHFEGGGARRAAEIASSMLD